MIKVIRKDITKCDAQLALEKCEQGKIDDVTFVELMDLLFNNKIGTNGISDEAVALAQAKTESQCANIRTIVSIKLLKAGRKTAYIAASMTSGAILISGILNLIAAIIK